MVGHEVYPVIGWECVRSGLLQVVGFFRSCEPVFFVCSIAGGAFVLWLTVSFIRWVRGVI